MKTLGKPRSQESREGVGPLGLQNEHDAHESPWKWILPCQLSLQMTAALVENFLIVRTFLIDVLTATSKRDPSPELLRGEALRFPPYRMHEIINAYHCGLLRLGVICHAYGI